MFLFIIISLFLFLLIRLLPLIVNETYSTRPQPFECGIESVIITRNRFRLQFFIIGLIFVVFDLEIVFMLGLILSTGLVNFFILIGFIVIIIGGLIYE